MEPPWMYLQFKFIITNPWILKIKIILQKQQKNKCTLISSAPPVLSIWSTLHKSLLHIRSFASKFNFASGTFKCVLQFTICIDDSFMLYIESNLDLQVASYQVVDLIYSIWKHKILVGHDIHIHLLTQDDTTLW
jgi:hypothetical protein